MIRYELDLTDVALIQIREQEAGGSNLPIPATRMWWWIGGFPATDVPSICSRAAQPLDRHASGCRMPANSGALGACGRVIPDRPFSPFLGVDPRHEKWNGVVSMGGSGPPAYFGG